MSVIYRDVVDLQNSEAICNALMILNERIRKPGLTSEEAELYAKARCALRDLDNSLSKRIQVIP